MNSTFARMFLFILLLCFLVPSTASAYSYGNANTEELAETFKTIAAKLNADQADWKASQAAYAEMRSEMESHFGTGVTKELDAAFAAKDKARVIADMQGALVLNLNRRFTYAEDGFADYNQAKLLLAKARATYETLKPYMTEQLTDVQLAALDKDFETALGALGNPGLFGAGKKEPDKALFQQTVKQIYDTVRPLFPLQGEAATSSPGGGVDEAPELAAEPTGQHAPMTQASKTNPIVTVSVLAGVVIVGVLVVWWTRRRRP